MSRGAGLPPAAGLEVVENLLTATWGDGLAVCLSGPVTVSGMAEPVDRIRLTDRLRLEPIGPVHAEDLWRLHQDAAVAQWHGGRWTLDTARRNAAAFGEAWRRDRVHKWIAYDRDTGELVGRGGPSRWRFEGQEWLEGWLDGAVGPVGPRLCH